MAAWWQSWDHLLSPCLYCLVSEAQSAPVFASTLSPQHHLSTSHLTSPRSGNFHTNVLIMQTPDSISSYQHPARTEDDFIFPHWIKYESHRRRHRRTEADTEAELENVRCGAAREFLIFFISSSVSDIVRTRSWWNCGVQAEAGVSDPLHADMRSARHRDTGLVLNINIDLEFRLKSGGYSRVLAHHHQALTSRAAIARH